MSANSEVRIPAPTYGDDSAFYIRVDDRTRHLTDADLRTSLITLIDNSRKVKPTHHATQFILDTLFNTGATVELIMISDREFLTKLYVYYTKLNYFVTNGMMSGMLPGEFFTPLLNLRSAISMHTGILQQFPTNYTVTRNA